MASLAQKAQARNAPTMPPAAADYWSQFQAEGTATTPGMAGPSGPAMASTGAPATPAGPAPLPAGMETGTFTGGGQYPLASFMGPGLLQPFTAAFQRPELSEATDPGYAARMAMGSDAIERSHAAKGTLRTGGLLKDLTQYAQDYASSEYDKVYDRAMGEYQTAHGIFDRNQANQFGRLNAMASMGQNAAAGVGSAAGQYGSSVGDLYTQQGNVLAAGQMGASDAWTGAANNMGNLGMMLAQYYATRNNPYAAYGGTPPIVAPNNGTSFAPPAGGY